MTVYTYNKTLSSQCNLTVRMEPVHNKLLFYCAISTDDEKQFINSKTLHMHNIVQSTLKLSQVKNTELAIDRHITYHISQSGGATGI